MISPLKVISISFFVLCQDCLRIAIYAKEKHCEQEFCQCGGQWCGCAGCNDTATQLLRGNRDYNSLGLQVPIANWSPVTGIEMKGVAA
ncbi:hypothetical protein ACK34J_18775 [Aeromonas veronii]